MTFIDRSTALVDSRLLTILNENLRPTVYTDVMKPQRLVTIYFWRYKSSLCMYICMSVATE